MAFGGAAVHEPVPRPQVAAADRLAADFLPAAVWAALSSSLQMSDREAEIARLVLDDESETAIADRLGISPHTVHSHLERLYRKLRVTSRSQLIRRVFEQYVLLESAHAIPRP